MTSFCFLIFWKIQTEEEYMQTFVIFHLDLRSLANNIGANILACLKAFQCTLTCF